jgi:hypothetical protein
MTIMSVRRALRATEIEKHATVKGTSMEDQFALVLDEHW